MKNEKIACSVGILTFNNEDTLRACLDSVSEFNEIIICDGGSIDKTLEIAKGYGCVVIEQDKKYKHPDNKIADFSGVRNQMLDCAKNDWFAYVDSDEYFSKEVVEEIRSIVVNKDPKGCVFKMPRKYVVKDEIIECSSFYPNYQTRFFLKDRSTRFKKKVHERVDPIPNQKLDTLENCVYVPWDKNMSDYIRKQNYYIDIEANRLKHLSLWGWFRWVIVWQFVSVLKYIVRYIRSLLICRGKHMPFCLEMLKIRYIFRLMWRVSKKRFED
ncbi:MAG: glycosyltransferase family 2 protein [Candidatus Pacebacteria bacterium]|nr:glycosyltransferase family 2 protein [Candidatus Paceibacterota bacterium]